MVFSADWRMNLQNCRVITFPWAPWPLPLLLWCEPSLVMLLDLECPLLWPADFSPSASASCRASFALQTHHHHCI